MTTAKMALKFSANPRLTRASVPALSLAALAPVRGAWTPTASGFEARLTGQLPDGRPWAQTVRLAACACQFGGWRFYLCCPTCEQRTLSLYWDRDCFVCRRCANLRYVSQTVRDPIRLLHHYSRLAESLARPGRWSGRFFRAAALGWRAYGAWAKHVAAGPPRRTMGGHSGETRGRARKRSA